MDGLVRAPAFSLRQLLYFVTVAEAGTIREAAARLHVTESAVSVAITELSGPCGCGSASAAARSG